MFKELKEPCLKKESTTHRVQASSVRLTALSHQTSWSQKNSRSHTMLRVLWAAKLSFKNEGENDFLINEKREFVTSTSALGEIPKGDFEAKMKGPRQLVVHMKK